jgi:hypothetical protein
MRRIRQDRRRVSPLIRPPPDAAKDRLTEGSCPAAGDIMLDLHRGRVHTIHPINRLQRRSEAPSASGASLLLSYGIAHRDPSEEIPFFRRASPTSCPFVCESCDQAINRVFSLPSGRKSLGRSSVRFAYKIARVRWEPAKGAQGVDRAERSRRQRSHTHGRQRCAPPCPHSPAGHLSRSSAVGWQRLRLSG